jgi:hypothetical protein
MVLNRAYSVKGFSACSLVEANVSEKEGVPGCAVRCIDEAHFTIH